MKFVHTRRGAATLSVLSNILLTLLKLLAATLTHSVGLLSEAVHSGVDLVAAGVAFFAVRKADSPADSAIRVIVLLGGGARLGHVMDGMSGLSTSQSGGARGSQAGGSQRQTAHSHPACHGATS